ncbi:MAG: hypothetical protein M1835_006739 [Candelina submexicana]|nr:MAG: hypothetical protein M1835_006739 [Candelina submexicana]
MTDQDLATKAPESDAAEGSIVPGDTKAQQGASMGEHCTTDRPTPTGKTPTGEMSKLGDVEVYITKPSDYPHSPSKLLLFLSSGTGIHSVNNQLQADKFAGEGFLVVMPDQSVELNNILCGAVPIADLARPRSAGDPIPKSVTDPRNYQESDPSLIEQVKLRAAETAKSFVIDMWLARQTPEKVLPLLHKVIEGAKEEFADAVANGGGVYAVGYCFGGRYVLLLAGEQPDTVKGGQAVKDEEAGVAKAEPIIKAGALAHGTLVTKQDIEALKAPVTMACVENDQLFPDDVREEGRKYLESKHIEHEINVYSNVPHGFAVLGEYEEETIKQSQQWAFDQMLNWLKAH